MTTNHDRLPPFFFFQLHITGSVLSGLFLLVVSEIVLAAALLMALPGLMLLLSGRLQQHAQRSNVALDDFACPYLEMTTWLSSLVLVFLAWMMLMSLLPGSMLMSLLPGSMLLSLLPGSMWLSCPKDQSALSMLADQ